MKILLVEDDVDLLDITAYSLRRERLAVVEAADGAQAIQRWRSERPDLVVLDIGLPKQDGFTVLQKLRESSAVPVIIVSGRGDEQDVMRGFTLGADDYVLKPFNAKQLAMRIRAVLRRVSAEPLEQTAPPIALGHLRIEPETQEVLWHDRFVPLTSTEFRVFHLLAMNAGRIVTTSRLLAYVWGYNDGDVSSLRTHISHIRSKLGLHSEEAAIAGVPGVGYRLTIDAARHTGNGALVAAVDAVRT